MMNNKKTHKVKRGEIYYYDFGQNEGSIQNGRRPVLVVQCDKGNTASPTTIVAAITTAVKKRYLPTHIFLGENFGLLEPSMVLLEQVKTINQSDLSDYMGIVDSDYVTQKINNGLKTAFGVRFYNPQPKSNVRCLCGNCLKDYMSNPDYVVRRLDPLSSVKDKCDKCNHVGWDYVVYDKRTACDKGVRK